MDVKDGRVVKGVNFVNLRDAGDPIELAQLRRAARRRGRLPRHHGDERRPCDDGRACGARERGAASAVLRGRGFRSVEDMRRMIAAGADKVSVNSAAVRDPELITRRARLRHSGGRVRHRREGVRGQSQQVGGLRFGRTHGDGHRRGGVGARGGSARGGEILLTSMDRDGSRDGFDCALTRAVARAVDVPVIASGGVGSIEHFAEGVIEGEADAVLAASVFHFGELTVREVKEYMRAQGAFPCACDRARSACFLALKPFSRDVDSDVVRRLICALSACGPLPSLVRIAVALAAPCGFARSERFCPCPVCTRFQLRGTVMDISSLAFDDRGLVPLHRAGCAHERRAHDGVDERGVDSADARAWRDGVLEPFPPGAMA